MLFLTSNIFRQRPLVYRLVKELLMPFASCYNKCWFDCVNMLIAFLNSFLSLLLFIFTSREIIETNLFSLLHFSASFMVALQFTFRICIKLFSGMSELQLRRDIYRGNSEKIFHMSQQKHMF